VDRVRADEPSPSEYLSRLHESAEIRVWIKDHRNAHTARLQFEQLALFCRRTSTSPEDAVRLAAAKPNTKFRASILGWAEAQRAQGRPDQYLKAIWYSIKSWLKHNEVQLSWSPPFNVLPAATLGNQRFPTVEEIRKLLAVVSPRNRVAVLILTTSGVRIGALSDRFEAGGITLADFPDLTFGRGGPKFRKTPPALHAPANHAKGWQEYYTCISTEASEALQAYLTERIQRVEKLSPGSSVIAPEPKASHSHFRRDREGSQFISGKSLGQAIRVGLRKVIPKGVRVRPHTLRAWTSTNLEQAEREGQITRTLREYFMGHHLKRMDTRYNVGKRLSDDQVEELRKACARV
jgi:integrase